MARGSTRDDLTLRPLGQVAVELALAAEECPNSQSQVCIQMLGGAGGASIAEDTAVSHLLLGCTCRAGARGSLRCALLTKRV
jgi:hypothetical protein